MKAQRTGEEDGGGAPKQDETWDKVATLHRGNAKYAD
jgi:hypothetical protein